MLATRRCASGAEPQSLSGYSAPGRRCLAVIVTAYLAGRGPALCATAANVLINCYFFAQPHFSFAVADARDRWSLTIFTGAGIGVSLLSRRLSRTRHFSRVALIVASSLLLIIVAALVWFDFGNSRDAEGWVEHTYQVLNASAAAVFEHPGRRCQAAGLPADRRAAVRGPLSRTGGGGANVDAKAPHAHQGQRRAAESPGGIGPGDRRPAGRSWTRASRCAAIKASRPPLRWCAQARVRI